MCGFVFNDRVSSSMPGRLGLIQPVFQVIMFMVLVWGLVGFMHWGVCWWISVWVLVWWYPFTLWVHLIISCVSLVGR